jgi:hypothetical protein
MCVCACLYLGGKLYVSVCQLCVCVWCMSALCNSVYMSHVLHSLNVHMFMHTPEEINANVSV